MSVFYNVLDGNYKERRRSNPLSISTINALQFESSSFVNRRFNAPIFDIDEAKS